MSVSEPHLSIYPVYMTKTKVKCAGTGEDAGYPIIGYFRGYVWLRYSYIHGIVSCTQYPVKDVGIAISFIACQKSVHYSNNCRAGSEANNLCLNEFRCVCMYVPCL